MEINPKTRLEDSQGDTEKAARTILVATFITGVGGAALLYGFIWLVELLVWAGEK